MSRLTGAQKEIEILREKRLPIVSQCNKIFDDGKTHLCSRAEDTEVDFFCKVYAFPPAKWKNGDCPMADEELRAIIQTEQAGKVRVGQQKQKKKSRR